MTIPSKKTALRRPLRVYLIDAHPVARLGLRICFEAHSSITVVGDAATLANAMSALRLCEPDVLITDTFPITKRLLDRQRCCILYTFESLEHVSLDKLIQHLSHRRAGFVLKNLPLHRFRQAVELIAAGKQFRDPAFLRLVRERKRQQALSGAGHHDTTVKKRRRSTGKASAG